MKFSTRTFAAAVVAAAAFSAPVLAERILTGSEAQSLLAGRRFNFNCFDGTTGMASYEPGGVARATYRSPTARETAMEEIDEGRVRSAGGDLCIQWQRLDSGREGCYRMVERVPGSYRIATLNQARWCDLTEH